MPSLPVKARALARPAAVINVLHADVVATAEGVPFWTRHVRMTILIAIVHVRPAMVFKVLASAFDAIVKGLPLEVSLVFRWRPFPWLLSNQHTGA